MKKISYKIMIAIAGCSAAIALLVGLVSIARSSSTIEKEAVNSLKYLTESKTSSLDRPIKEVEDRVEDMTFLISSTFDLQKIKSDPAYLDTYSLEIENYIKKVAEATDNALGASFFFNPELANKARDVYYADVKGDKTFVRQKQLGIEKYKPDAEDMKWYYDAVKSKKGMWVDPYVYEALKINMMSYSKAVYIGDTLIGVAVADMRFDSLSNLVSGIKAYDTGYAFLLNGNYDYLVHPTLTQKENLKTVSGGIYKYMADAMDKNESDILHLNFGGTQKIMGFSKLINGYVLAVTVSEDEVLKDINLMRYFIFVLTLLGIIISTAVAFFVGRMISKPVEKLSSLFKIAETGDLTVVSDIKSSDEVGQLSKAFNSMLGGMRDFIAKSRDLSVAVASSSEEMMASSEEVSKVSEQVAAAVSDLATGATEQAQATEKSSGSINGITQGLGKIAGDMKESNELANNTKNSVAAGHRSVQLQKVKMEENKKATSLTAEAVQELSDKSVQVGQILEVIGSIADQTNLLSLNAAIEAARAGEQGRGFAVVAEEIRKLAEQSAVSARKIEGIIKEVQECVHRTVLQIDKSSSAVNEQEKAVEETARLFDEITADADNIALKVKTVYEATAALQEETENAKDEIDHISGISQEAAANTEEISASTEEQTSTFAQIAQSAEELSKLAVTLQESILKFKV